MFSGKEPPNTLGSTASCLQHSVLGFTLYMLSPILVPNNLLLLKPLNLQLLRTDKLFYQMKTVVVIKSSLANWVWPRLNLTWFNTQLHQLVLAPHREWPLPLTKKSHTLVIVTFTFVPWEAPMCIRVLIHSTYMRLFCASSDVM